MKPLPSLASLFRHKYRNCFVWWGGGLFDPHGCVSRTIRRTRAESDDSNKAAFVVTMETSASSSAAADWREAGGVEARGGGGVPVCRNFQTSEPEPHMLTSISWRLVPAAPQELPRWGGGGWAGAGACEGPPCLLCSPPCVGDLGLHGNNRRG